MRPIPNPSPPKSTGTCPFATPLLLLGTLALWHNPMNLSADFGPKDGALIGTISASDMAMKFKDDHGNIAPNFSTPSFVEVELGKEATVDLKDTSEKRNEYNQTFKYSGWSGEKPNGKLASLDAMKVAFHEGSNYGYFIDWGDGSKDDWVYKPKFTHKYSTDGVFSVKIKLRQGGIQHQWFELTERVQATTRPVKKEILKGPSWFGLNGAGSDFENFKFNELWVQSDLKDGTPSPTRKPLGIYHRTYGSNERARQINFGKGSTSEKTVWSEEQQAAIKFEIRHVVNDWDLTQITDSMKQLWAEFDAGGKFTGYKWESTSVKMSGIKNSGSWALIKKPETSSYPPKVTGIPDSDVQNYFLDDLSEGYKFETFRDDEVNIENSPVTYTISDFKDSSLTAYVAHGHPNPNGSFSVVEKEIIISVFKPLPPVSGSAMGLTLSPTVMGDTKARIIHGEEDKPLSISVGDIGLHIKGTQKDLGNYPVWDPNYDTAGVGGPNDYQMKYPESWAGEPSINNYYYDIYMYYANYYGKIYGSWWYNYFSSVANQYKNNNYWGGNSFNHNYANYWQTKGKGYFRKVSGNDASKNPKIPDGPQKGGDTFQYYQDQYYGDVNLTIDWGDKTPGAARGITQAHFPYMAAPNQTVAGNADHTFIKNGRYDGKVGSAYKNLFNEKTLLTTNPKMLYRFQATQVRYTYSYQVLVYDYGWVNRYYYTYRDEYLYSAYHYPWQGTYVIAYTVWQ